MFWREEWNFLGKIFIVGRIFGFVVGEFILGEGWGVGWCFVVGNFEIRGSYFCCK